VIIRIIGGNGAGKSYIVHQVIALYPHLTYGGDRTCFQLEGNRDGLQNVFVPGHYRIANGGLDTVPSGDRLGLMRELMEHHVDTGWHVLYEVSSQKEGSEWMLEQHEAGHKCRPILLTTSDDERVASVRKRGHNIREDLIRASGRKAEKLTRELCEGGVPIAVLDRDAALACVLEHLRGAS
jgi:hypothetical protein